jgi:hypothetical protein
VYSELSTVIRNSRTRRNGWVSSGLGELVTTKVHPAALIAK